ncbi:MAG: T9SS type A sorting domain-containing protein [Cytophagaceae bacterium]
MLISGDFFYPNPVQDLLFLRKDYEHLVIIDMKGQIIYSSAKSADSIQTHEWPVGMYLLKFQTKDGLENFKILKF